MCRCLRFGDDIEFEFSSNSPDDGFRNKLTLGDNNCCVGVFCWCCLTPAPNNSFLDGDLDCFTAPPPPSDTLSPSLSSLDELELLELPLELLELLLPLLLEPTLLVPPFTSSPLLFRRPLRSIAPDSRSASDTFPLPPLAAAATSPSSPLDEDEEELEDNGDTGPCLLISSEVSRVSFIGTGGRRFLLLPLPLVVDVPPPFAPAPLLLFSGVSDLTLDVGGGGGRALPAAGDVVD